MRRPSLGGQQNDEDGDLSRLASSTVDSITCSGANNNNTSRSSTASGSSSVDNCPGPNGKASSGVPEEAAVIETNVCAVTYLPKIIELEWQQQQQNHRKRKERLDSTSSNSQTDRKVIRSNSEENLAEETTAIIETEHNLIEIEDHPVKSLENALPTSRDSDKGDEKAIRQSSSSPSRAHHPHVLQHSLSSVSHHQYHHGVGGGQHGKKNGCANGGILQSMGSAQIATSALGDDHYSDGEHERRRSSERFCRSRAPHGRKSSSCSSAKKSSSSSSMAAGLGSSGGRHYSRASALSGVTALRSQNVINMADRDEGGQGGYKYDLSALKTERRGFTSRDSQKMKKQKDGSTERIATATDENHDGSDANKMDVQIVDDEENYKPRNDPLPWNEFPDETPVVCPRFAENTFDHVINVSDKFIKIHPPAKKENPIKYVNNENMKTRDIMKKYGSSTTGLMNNNSAWAKNRNGNELRLMIITPEERVKQINGRLTKLKKRIVQYEEGYERDFGFKPGKVDTLNDKAMKTIMTEMQKLKRERQAIKTCGEVVGAGLVTPISISGTGTGSIFGGLKEIPRDSQPMSGDMKINKMQETVTDIETVLQDRRKDEHRLDPLEKLSMDQLLQEKTAVQRGLLYLEGIYGRPDSKEERDLARPLYDRYRQIKRMLNRNSSLNSGTIDLPTILEHEAMVFTSTNNTPSTDATPPDCQIVEDPPADTVMPVVASKSTDSDSSSLNDNLHQLSITELWHQLDIVRDEKKVLRRTIKDFEQHFEAESGRKMLKGDRKAIEETYALYKQKKGRLRLLDALVKKHMAY